MDIRKLILHILNEKGEVKACDIVKVIGFSREYINRFFRELRNEGKIILLGKANKAHYILANKQALIRARKDITTVHRILHNLNISEDIILDGIKRGTGIFLEVPKSVLRIIDYAFTEMLNNAIEHSHSKTIEITMERHKENIYFNVIDKGIGIFNSIMEKKRLQDEMEAIQDLMKGKLSTAPETHSGEGIFFTSKAADILTIQSAQKKLIFNNLLKDVFIKDIKKTKGTKAAFSIAINSERNLTDIFKEYTDESFEFSKTKVEVRLFKMAKEYISRSQARRILTGLDRFKTVILDFKDVQTVGQAFADEVFRVWKLRHPDITIIPQNANENIRFMINRAA